MAKKSKLAKRADDLKAAMSDLVASVVSTPKKKKKRKARKAKVVKAAKKTVRKKAAKSSTKGKTTAAATKAANIAKLNGQIHTLRGDAKALAKSANHLDALANSL